MRSEVIVYGSVQMSISKSIQCRYIANVILRVHASWQCQWGKKLMIEIPFEAIRHVSQHNRMLCMPKIMTWTHTDAVDLQLQILSRKYSKIWILLCAHFKDKTHIRIYYVIEFWMKPFVFVSKWSGMLTSNLFGVDFGNKSHLKTKCRFLLSNSIIFTLWHQKNKYWKWENDIHTHA